MTEIWVKKAEADLITATRELEAEEAPNYEATCFHAHQCVERYLKARLQEAEVDFPETSHLVVLLHLCQDLEPAWEDYRDHLRTLTSFAARAASPEWIPDPTMAREAYDCALAFREAALRSFGLVAEDDDAGEEAPAATEDGQDEEAPAAAEDAPGEQA